MQALERDGWLDNTGTCMSIFNLRQCLTFVFLPFLKQEPEEYVHFWNTHHIRPTRLAACPSGRPDDMYDMPQLFGKLSYHSLCGM